MEFGQDQFSASDSSPRAVRVDVGALLTAGIFLAAVLLAVAIVIEECV